MKRRNKSQARFSSFGYPGEGFDEDFSFEEEMEDEYGMTDEDDGGYEVSFVMPRPPSEVADEETPADTDLSISSFKPEKRNGAKINPSRPGLPAKAYHDLKNCPYCGKKARIGHVRGTKFGIGCRNPKCFAPWKVFDKVYWYDVISSWNKRA